MEVLLGARQVEAFDLGEGEMSGSISTPLSVDLNHALEPLLDALTGLLTPDLELNPATIAAGYTIVSEQGVPGGEPLGEPTPFRCYIN